MISATLQIPFKGSRDYLHGTDIFDQVLLILTKENAGFLDVFEISFHAMAREPLRLIIGEEPANARAAAVGYYQGNDGRVRFWLSETDGEIVGRVPYPENEVVRKMAFSQDSATAAISPTSGFSNIEVWIPMVKEMHTRIFPDVDGKWVFARAKMSAYSLDHSAAEYGVKLASKLGHKLTRNEVFLDGRKVGDIFFSLM